jgi:hypothetical protein
MGRRRVDPWVEYCGGDALKYKKGELSSEIQATNMNLKLGLKTFSLNGWAFG